MDRCAVFVDAGYVYAAGGQLCCGTRSRKELKLEPKPLLELLAKEAAAATSMPVLRTYWYDAARDGIRTQEQRSIAALPDVKLRLGRLNGQNQQKGVDALIYRDMITLSQQRAVNDIVLLSGDEDLREGVRAAQDYGVRVVLIGIAADQGYNQSEELTYEADRLVTWNRDSLLPVFSLRPKAPQPNLSATVTITENSDLATTADYTVHAVEFAKQWMAAATEAEVLELRNDSPRIPRPLDVELMLHVEQKVGATLAEAETARRKVRAAWWRAIGNA
jgi:uncharacterized LabA/DUF88 family protein